MGVLIDGKWTDGELPQETGEDRPVQARRQRLPRPHHRRRLVGLQGRARPLSPLCRARLPVGAPHADLSRAEEARWADLGRLFDPGPEEARLDLRATIRAIRTASPTRSTASTICTRPMSRAIRPTPARSRCRRCGTRRPSASSTTSRPRSSGCSTPSSTPSPATAPTTIRRRCAPRSTPSTSASITTSTTACTAAGFAKSQAAYEEAYDGLFATLDWLEERLSRQRYLVGNQITEADWRLFPTLVRFDVAYFSIFKCNRQRIADYPNLSNYMRELYQVPGVAGTVTPRYYVINYYSIAEGEPDHDHPEGNAGRSRPAARSRRLAPDIAGLTSKKSRRTTCWSSITTSIRSAPRRCASR